MRLRGWVLMNKKNEKSLVPKLRFPEFRDAGAWGTRELGEFITERNQFPTGSVSLFSLTIEDGITPKTERYERSFLVNDEVGAYKLVLPDDFAYNPMNLRFGAIGRHSGTENVAVSKYYNIFFCDKTVDSKFCEIYFKSDQMIAFYDNMAIGSLIEKRRVHFSDFLKFNIRFPLLPEQQKIAGCLSSLDELITAEVQKIDTLKAHKKGLMQQLFPAEGGTVPELRFPEFQDAGEWDVKKLGENGISTFVKERIPVEQLKLATYVSTENLLSDYAGVTTASKIPPNGSFTRFKKGDILISNIRPYLKKVWSASIDGASSNDVIVIRAESKVSDSFLTFLLKNDEFINYIMKGAKGVKMPRGDISLMKEYPLTFPAPEEQQKIAECLSSLDELITAEAQKIDTLKAHKKGLMQGLFPSADEVSI